MKLLRGLRRLRSGARALLGGASLLLLLAVVEGGLLGGYLLFGEPAQAVRTWVLGAWAAAGAGAWVGLGLWWRWGVGRLVLPTDASARLPLKVDPAAAAPKLSPKVLKEGVFYRVGPGFWVQGALGSALLTAGVYLASCGGIWLWSVLLPALIFGGMLLWRARWPDARLQIKEWKLQELDGDAELASLDLRRPITLEADPVGVISLVNDRGEQLMLDPRVYDRPQVLAAAIAFPIPSIQAFLKAEKPDRFVPGSHLEVQRSLYTHHGVYVGGGWVIHYTGNVFETIAGVHEPEIRFDRLTEFGDRPKVTVVEYPSGAYSPEQTVQRAFQRLHEQDYDVFDRNCEHFATWCRTGRWESAQVQRMDRVIPRESMATLRRFAGLLRRH